MAINFLDIQYFIEVAENKNISRSAERIGVSQPSLSIAIKRLEDSLGLPLLSRHRNGVQLTKARQEFLVRGKKLLLDWQQLRVEVNKNFTEVQGTYSLGCHVSVGLYSLHRFLPTLYEKYPLLQIRLVHDISRSITEQVISHKIDFGIVVNPVRHPDLVIKELVNDDVGFWRAKKSKSFENKPLICDPQLTQTQKLLKKLAKNKVFFNREIHSSSLENIARLTAADAGIGILPSKVALAMFADELTLFDPKWPIFKDSICLCYRADSQKSKGAKLIIETILKAFLDSRF
jgi:DNA-binding transcriptional LysR family regulator